jgi:methyltransferase (TIGR00027 family)
MSQDRQWDIRTGPGFTALGIAATRALESQRPDRLVDDRYAAAFVAAVPSSIPAGLRWPQPGTAVSEVEAFFMQSTSYIGVRTRYLDDFLTAACREGCVQVVILAAGLDSRAYRLGWPAGVRLFEIDQPDVLAFKDQVLNSLGAVAGCARYTVGINLQDNWPAALREAGFDPSVPTAWLAEGLLMYLPAEAETRLYAGIHDLSAPGSQLCVEHQADPGILKHSSQEVDAMRQLSPGVDQLLQSDARPSAARWLSDRGWSATDQTSTDIARRYGRDLTEPVTSNAPEQVMKMAEGMALLSARHTR